MSAVILRARGLAKAFDEGGRRRVVLDGADLELVQGEQVAVLGASGSGKSTLLHLLGGIDDPDAGTVEVEGRDLFALSDAERTRVRRRRIGFVFQFFHLLPTLNVRDNVALPLELEGLPRAAARERAGEALTWVGLGDRGDGSPDRLSGGEQQRVALARALVTRPALILADEPTGNLDPERADGVLELLSRQARERSAALVMVTHSQQAARGVDRVLRLKGGRLGEEPVAPAGDAQ
jgi:ABC-type lipoprotein export system ATPase subunit